MKTLLTVALSFALFISFIQRQNKRSPVYRSLTKTDTIFLKKAKDSKDNTIYIEQNRNSKYYKRLLDFSITGEDSSEYAENRGFLQKLTKRDRRKFKLQGLARQWVPVYKYLGHYYLYYPGDVGNMGRLMVTDSTVCPLFMDGYFPSGSYRPKIGEMATSSF